MPNPPSAVTPEEVIQAAREKWPDAIHIVVDMERMVFLVDENGQHRQHGGLWSLEVVRRGFQTYSPYLVAPSPSGLLEEIQKQ